MLKIGRVIEKRTASVIVSVPEENQTAKGEGCPHCSLHGENKEYEVFDYPAAEIGDTVEIDLQEGQMARDAFLVYGTPFLSFLIGIFVGFLLLPEYKDIGSFAIGILFAFATFFLLRAFQKKKPKPARIQITKVL